MTFRSLGNFYNADERRLNSREHDYGLWWRNEAGGPLHRAAWVCETGELYIAQLGAAERPVEVLALIADRTELETLLAGWRERCAEPGSLQWLRARAADAGRAGAPRSHPSRSQRAARALATAAAARSRLAPRAALTRAALTRAAFSGPEL